MPSCREVTNRTSDLIDGELDLASRLKVRLHLLACHHCRRFVKQMCATVGLLGSRIDDEVLPVNDKLVVAYKARSKKKAPELGHFFYSWQTVGVATPIA